MPRIVLADANNKRQETKWAGIFSMQTVCCSRSDRNNSRCWVCRCARSGREAPGQEQRACRPPGPRVEGGEGKEPWPSRLPEKVKLKTCVCSMLSSLPNDITEHVFHSAFFLISRVAYEWCFLFLLFSNKLKTVQSFSAGLSPALCKYCSHEGRGGQGRGEQASAGGGVGVLPVLSQEPLGFSIHIAEPSGG